MDENLNLEQPLISGDGAEAQTTENQVEQISANENEGSNKFGKFASADELFSAYKNLEAEFTKKAQKLAEYEKEKQADNTQVPAYEKEDWEEMVQTFYENNPKAKGFEKEISQIILGDKQIACAKSPLDSAWQKLTSEKFRTEDEIATDNEFLDKYVLNNPFVQESVLKTYLENLKQAPALIASSKGKQINIAMKEKPKNLQEARAQVENLFK